MASVSFTGTQFIVKNLAASEWTDIVVVVNRPNLWTAGYQFRFAQLGAGESKTIGAMLFAKDDGTRFNSGQTKPMDVEVRANVSGSAKVHVGAFQ
jgi:hypothetical protein